MNNKQGSFLEPKMIIAIILVALSWFAWDSHMRKKYPQVYTQKTKSSVKSSQEKEETPANLSATLPSNSATQLSDNTNEAANLKQNPEIFS